MTEHTGAVVNRKESSASENEKAYVPLHNEPTANRPRMRLLSWRPLEEDSLRGIASVQLLIELVIHDVPGLISGGKVWAILPSKPQTDPEGQVKPVRAASRPTPILEWRDRTLADRFSAAVIEPILEKHGAGALDSGGGR
jgi:hypothetical protein